MTQPWFKAKDYGWGWYPATWQGWLVLALYIGAIFLKFCHIDPSSRTDDEAVISMIVPVIILTIALIGVCYATGEKPEWRWAGKPVKRK